MKNYYYDLTIVLPTLGRKGEVEAMLNSIYNSDINEHYKIEILVIDQNFSSLLDDIITKYRSLEYPIVHYKVSFRGLSKAKNYGVSRANGKYVCFVDDDAEFQDGTINVAFEELERCKIDVISGRCIDREGNDSVQKFSRNETILSLNDFEGKFVESTMFFKTELCLKYPYDEEMGVGCFYGAEEGYDLVYRMLNDGVIIKYNPHIKFYHPQTVMNKSSEKMVRRAFTYRCGYGHLCRKYKLRKKYYTRISKLIVYLTILPFYKPREFKFYMADLLGSVVGYYL